MIIYNNNNNNNNQKNNNDVIIKLIKNTKTTKLFVITFLVTEQLAQKTKK